MKYRDHRGSLDKAMETTMEVDSVEQIKQHLNKSYNPFGKEVADIRFEHAGMDERTGWDTYYVLQRFSDEKEFTVAGMSDGKLKTSHSPHPPSPLPHLKTSAPAS